MALAEATNFFLDDVETDSSLSTIATGVIGSEILKIAADVRQAVARGEKLLNLTVGDFSPEHFPIPRSLQAEIDRAYRQHQTNYPPSDGVLALREQVAAFVEREQGLRYPLESIVIAGGARPILYGTYRTVLDRGDTVVYSVPSWNNNHYSYLTEVVPVEIEGRPENGFFPTASEFEPHLAKARLIVLNSPMNPSGTVVDPEELRKICGMILEENSRRKKLGRKTLFLLYDQIYSALHFKNSVRSSPPELAPEMFPYTILLDGISKQFAATGLRVGWALGPPALIRRMRDILGHVGAWAPKPEQVATARFLADREGVESYRSEFLSRVEARLELLYSLFSRLKAAGLPVEAIEPQGAIYLSARFALAGQEIGGSRLRTNEEIRKLLLQRAGIAAVPFQAFGYRPENGWFRLSVGAVSEQDIVSAEPRLRECLGVATLAARSSSRD
ncbi:MAG: pyridoxal phosphate-dependent aminotransferase [Thermoanaerobaculia bacterium]